MLPRVLWERSCSADIEKLASHSSRPGVCRRDRGVRKQQYVGDHEFDAELEYVVEFEHPVGRCVG